MLCHILSTPSSTNSRMTSTKSSWSRGAIRSSTCSIVCGPCFKTLNTSSLNSSNACEIFFFPFLNARVTNSTGIESHFIKIILNHLHPATMCCCDKIYHGIHFFRRSIFFARPSGRYLREGVSASCRGSTKVIEVFL